MERKPWFAKKGISLKRQKEGFCICLDMQPTGLPFVTKFTNFMLGSTYTTRQRIAYSTFN